ncbi:hypothetical protein OSB04_003503 [Centaurea solstitialis]|uniref:Uncharacterized protein n=1 Tax=Centaurea solstitialis TaxID=347529 RepID=A0AA38UC65_9ASTR|nr:hypothetical protein OSB04_003503 [Centaurea solstitialis]
MEDSGAILSHLSALKDMLDQVNEEIEANIQLTREIESEIVKCSEFSRDLAVRESELMKTVYMLQYEIEGLMAINAESRKTMECLEKEMSCLKMKQAKILGRMNKKREAFSTLCLDFQKEIDEDGNGKLGKLLTEKECLENEVHLLKRKTSSLQSSMSEFIEEILEDIDAQNSALIVEIESGNLENDKLVKDINELKTALLAVISP